MKHHTTNSAEFSDLTSIDVESLLTSTSSKSDPIQKARNAVLRQLSTGVAAAAFGNG